MERKYEGVWKKLVEHPDKTVKVRVTSTSLVARVRKAVWKEKGLDETSKCPEDGILFKEKYRLTCEVKHIDGTDAVNLFFRLSLANKIFNI